MVNEQILDLLTNEVFVKQFNTIGNRINEYISFTNEAIGRQFDTIENAINEQFQTR